MKKPSSFVLITLSVLAVLSLLVLFFLLCFERVSSDHYTGFTGEAARNPYFAAELFLESRGYRVNYVRSAYMLNNLPPGRGTVFFLAGRQNFSPALLDRLVQWTRGGGNLLIAFYWEWILDGDEKHFMDAIDIRVTRLNITGKKGESTESAYKAVNISPPELEHSLSVVMDKSLVFETRRREVLWSATYNKRDILVSYNLGAGYLVVMGNMIFLENNLIGEEDNAEFLWYLLSPDSLRGDIYFIVEDGPLNAPPSLFRIILEEAWTMLIALCFFIVLLCWRYSRRFGPVIVRSDEVRRSLLEHIYATGRFLWKNGQAGELLESSQKAARRKLLMGNRDYKTPPREALAGLKSATGISDHELKLISTNPSAVSGRQARAAQLLGIMKSLERIKRIK